jgi:hypothetical protein
MNRRSQTSKLPIHTHYFIGAWIFVSIRFSKRLLLLDERSDDFLKTLVYLGGYCTIEQAQKLGLANSARRVVARLEALKQSGFLKQIAHYPVVYQVTGSATRLVGSDLMARRQRTPLTIRCRLLGVNFYLEAKAWPADFILDHAKKTALLNGVGCPTEALPHIGGQPYLWQEFVLRRDDGTICVAAVDRAHDTAKYQTRTLAQRYSNVLEHLPAQPHRQYPQPEAEYKARFELCRQTVKRFIEAELDWLTGKQGEPEWPEFPPDPARPRRRVNRTPGSPKARPLEEPPEPDMYADHHGAALWLGGASTLFDVAISSKRTAPGHSPRTVRSLGKMRRRITKLQGNGMTLFSNS